jgi:type II secretory pathway component PulC
MSRPVLVLNILMAGLSVLFLVRIADAVFRPGPALPIRVASSPTPINSAVVADSSRSRTAYDLIPARNLFHPDRAQPKRSDALGALPVAPALLLYGVVWSEDNPLAYVEDPTTKKIFGYRRGDPMAGGFVERIEPDRIVIQRTGGPIEILLRAPNKPRPVAAATAPTEAAATPSPPQPAPSAADGPQGRPRGSRSRTE